MTKILLAIVAGPPELFRILGPADDSTKQQIADCRHYVATSCQLIEVNFDAISAAAETIRIDGVEFERKMSEGKTVYFEVIERLMELNTLPVEDICFQSKVGGLPAYLRVSESTNGNQSK